jgi:hypothetical protein
MSGVFISVVLPNYIFPTIFRYFYLDAVPQLFIMYSADIEDDYEQHILKNVEGSLWY